MIKKCQHCEREFTKSCCESKKVWSGRKFCSKSCANSVSKNGKLFEKGFTPWNKGKELPRGRENYRYTSVKKECKECNSVFIVKNYRKNTAKFCSQICSHKNRKCENVISKCEECGNKFTKPHNPNRKYKFCSKKCMGTHNSRNCKIEKIAIKCACCEKPLDIYPRELKRGKKCCSHACASSYKDKGKSSFAMKLRKSKQYREWRIAVFERDNYTCQECGVTGGKLNADHIKPFCLFPELRLDISNGRTLCENCHRQTETFGRKALNFFKNDTASSRRECVISVNET